MRVGVQEGVEGRVEVVFGGNAGLLQASGAGEAGAPSENCAARTIAHTYNIYASAFPSSSSRKGTTSASIYLHMYTSYILCNYPQPPARMQHGAPKIGKLGWLIVHSKVLRLASCTWHLEIWHLEVPCSACAGSFTVSCAPSGASTQAHTSGASTHNSKLSMPVSVTDH